MSTTKPSPRAPTLADLDALPPGIVGEIIEGVLYTMTRPPARHQRTGLVEARVLTVHRLDSADWRLIGTYSDETEARIAPFDAIALNVADWWPPG